MISNSLRGVPIAVLPDSVSKRIAAGEVIERPASVVRELIDNSLDAGAEAVEVEYRGGGLDSLRVRDTGWGMSREDLEKCHLPHATSKIRSLDDLDRSRTLGFRGEALSSIAAVAELEIVSFREGDDSGNRILLRGGAVTTLDSVPANRGTSVDVRRLFADFPARRRFLGRARGEATAIRNTLLDKAIPFPDVRFTLSSESRKILTLPPSSLVRRVSQAFGQSVREEMFQEISGSGDGFSLTVVAGHPELFRRDRRLIQVFVNRRRVWEFRLMQAVEYAYTDVLHGGLYPVASLFLDIDPDKADFNIHPAKREVRLRTAGEIHHRIVELLRAHLHAYTVKHVSLDRELTFPPSATGGTPSLGYSPEPTKGKIPFFAPHESPAGGYKPEPLQPHSVPTQPDDSPTDLTFVGFLFETFIIVQRSDRVYIIDQHAAHERILYDRFRESRASQPLLIPEEFEVTEDQDASLSRVSSEYRSLGIVIERREPRRWAVASAPPEYRENLEDLIETILELGGLEEAWDRRFLAELACKAAVKGGDRVDSGSALKLAHTTLNLPVPRCPHGRPLWVELDRNDLLRLIGRL